MFERNYLPTPVSPIKTILNSRSWCSRRLIAVVVVEVVVEVEIVETVVEVEAVDIAS